MIINEKHLQEKLKKTIVDEAVYRLSENKATVKICQGGVEFFAASRYNPVKEGEAYAGEKYGQNGAVFLYGLGLGYHVKGLIKLLRQNQRLYIVECNLNLVKLAFDNTDIKKYLQDERVEFFADDNFDNTILYLKNIFGNKEPDLHVILFEPSLRAIPESLTTLKDMLETFYFSAKSIGKFQEMMLSNRKFNLSQGYENGGKTFKNYFQGVPLIIVCAGPSLNENAEALKSVGDKALIMAVGRIAKFLSGVGVGVVPDFYIETESQDIYWRNYRGLDSCKPPIFMLSTAFQGLSQYGGKKYILFEKTSGDFSEKEFTVESGGSVSTAALSLGVLMGCSPIIFVGQDLCYWSEHTHAGSQKIYKKVKTAREVTGINGESYYTPTNMYMYLKWIERFISYRKNTRFINCTARGAKIHGMEHMGLSDILKELKACEKIIEYRENSI